MLRDVPQRLHVVEPAGASDTRRQILLTLALARRADWLPSAVRVATRRTSRRSVKALGGGETRPPATAAPLHPWMQIQGYDKTGREESPGGDKPGTGSDPEREQIYRRGRPRASTSQSRGPTGLPMRLTVGPSPEQPAPSRPSPSHPLRRRVDRPKQRGNRSVNARAQHRVTRGRYNTAHTMRTRRRRRGAPRHPPGRGGGGGSVQERDFFSVRTPVLQSALLPAHQCQPAASRRTHSPTPEG